MLNLSLQASADSVDLIYGGAIARGIEAARKTYYIQGRPSREAVDAGLNEAGKYYGGFEPREGVFKTYNSVLSMIESYFIQWPLDTDPIRPYQDNAIEFTFAIDTGIRHPSMDRNIYYVGKFDMLGKLPDLIFPIDEKTTGRSFWNFGKGWELRAQFIGYIFGCRAYGIPTSKLLVRGCAALKYHEEFTQVWIDVTDQQLTRWYEQLTREIHAMIQAYQTGVFEYNFDASCKLYNKPCPYIELCAATDDKDWFSMYIQKEPWNPLKLPGGEL